MRVVDRNWMQLEAYLERDDRIVLPLGCTEQHAYLSLGVDTILSERVAVEAAEPLGVPVLPPLAYGITPYFAAYPGSPSVSVDTYCALLRDILSSLFGQGFKRFLIVNGHGGNRPARPSAGAWAATHSSATVLWHDWWAAPHTRAAIDAIDPDASHASWMESFPWTRLDGVASPSEHKAKLDLAALRELDPAEIRARLGDGNVGGHYERPDEEMLRVWSAGVQETRELLEHGWRTRG
jgi:creatinine amidohydrolase